MTQVKYVQEYDQLVIEIKKVKPPYFPYGVMLKNGIELEFCNGDLSAITIPHFFQSLQRPPALGAKYEYEGVQFFDKVMVITIMLDQQRINIKADLSELEN